MAAASLPAQKQEDFKEEFLACSICFELYDNGNHQAKCLPCLHTYCKNCLERHSGKRPKFNCPKCRYLVILPGGTVESLPNNFLVENLKAYQDIFNPALSCGSCNDEDNHAINFCGDCRCFLCQGCVDAHRKFALLRSHELSTIAELQEKKENPLVGQHQQCKKHITQDLTLFCKDTECKVTLCATCGLINHRNHELVDITSALDEIVVDMRKSSAVLTTRNQELAKKRATTETEQKTLTENFNKKAKEMKVSVQKLRKEIDDRHDKAQSKLKQMYEAEMKSIATNIESINFLSDQMSSASEFANQACNGNQAMQVLSSQTQILKRLDELATFELPKTTSTKTDFDLTDKHDKATTQMQTLLQDLCDVDWHQHIDPAYCTCTFQVQYQDHVQPQVLDNGWYDTRQEYQPWPVPSYFTAIVKMVDTGEKMITTGGAKISVWQDLDKEEGVELTVRDNNDGTYSFTVNDYMTHNIHVKVNGTSIAKSPFSLP